LAQASDAIYPLPQDVGMAGMPRGLLDNVHQDPPQRGDPVLARIRGLRQGGQAGADPDDLVAASTSLPVLDRGKMALRLRLMT
jgi:hypothetical protein